MAEEFTHENLETCLKELAKNRPIFHSEADFQFALAWKIKERCNIKDVRLEYPFTYEKDNVQGDNETWYVDIVVILHSDNVDKMVPIELKYKRAGLSNFKFEQDGYTETFNLKNHGARDFGRYDCLKDVWRVEEIVNSGEEGWDSEGYVIWLTNDKAYWNENGTSERDENFSLHDGRHIEQNEELNWKNITIPPSKTLGDIVGKNRTTPILFSHPCTIKWQDYRSEEDKWKDLYKRLSERPNGEFQYALLHITKDKCSTCSNPTSHQYD